MSKGNVNKLILVGYLGHDPELRHTPNGNPVLNLSVATSRELKNAEGEVRTETVWHRATVWGKTAENCARFLTKGSRVYLEGVLQIKSWTDRNGQPRKSTEIEVENIQFLGGRGGLPTSAAEPAETVSAAG
jgi:single-strand DNA-binding protein